LYQPESAYVDPASQSLYISNINGDPSAKDGNGFITKADLAGKVKKLKWISGLNAPKGLRACGGRLYVSDIDELIVIKLSSGAIERRIAVPGAKFLNDVVADKKCNVYVSDTLRGAVYKMEPAGEPQLWVEGDNLESPNGLFVEGQTLFVASWGLTTDWTTRTPGRLLAIDLDTRAVSPQRGPHGNLDGLERVGADWLVSDFMAGTVLRSAPDGRTAVLLHGMLNPADLGYVAAQDLLLVPEMKRGTVSAYKLSSLAR
jgi:hypothetical protein